MEKLSGHKLLCLKQNLFRPCAQAQRWGGRAPAASWQARCPKTTCAASSEDKLKAAMQDPKVTAQMQALNEQMKSPEAQQSAAQMQAVMQNPAFMAKMQELQQDPELQNFWKGLQQGGMPAMMKAMNDPVLIAKLSEKMGDLDIPGVAPAAAPEPAAPPDINSLLDAARHGDLEAVEDFIAVGKDVNETDAEKRSPLHYAVAYSHPEIVSELLSNGADVSAVDARGNSVLHYAAGYGRVGLVEMLINAGAKGSSKSDTGHTAYELVKSDKRNPILADEKALKLVESAST